MHYSVRVPDDRPMLNLKNFVNVIAQRLKPSERDWQQWMRLQSQLPQLDEIGGSGRVENEDDEIVIPVPMRFETVARDA